MVGRLRPLGLQGRGLSWPAFSGFDVPATGWAALPFPDAFRNADFFARYYRSLNNFRAFPAVRAAGPERPQRPNTALAGPVGGTPGRCSRRCSPPMRLASNGAAQRPRFNFRIDGGAVAAAKSLAYGLNRHQSRADTIFQTSGFSWAKVAFGPCRPNPPSYMRLTVAISRIVEYWGFG